MNKAQLLATFRSERGKLEELLDAVGIDRMDSGRVSGFYSTKDVVAHLWAYEAALVTWLKEAEHGRVYFDDVLDQPDLDARNAAVYEANKHRDAADVIQDFRGTLDALDERINLLTDDELTNIEATARFVLHRWRRKQALWQCIADDSYEHQQEHVRDIERWLVENGRVA